MNMVQSSPANWSDLPGDLVCQLIEKLTRNSSLSDYIRFGVVCSSWRFFFLKENYEHIKLSSQLPILLVPTPFLIDEADSNNNYKEEIFIRDYYNLKPGMVRKVCMSDYYNPKHEMNRQDFNMHKSTRSFYSLSEKKVYNFQLPVPYYKNCRGSSHGWLVTVECDENYSVKLFNPFRSFNNEIQLPPLTTYTNTEYIRDSFFMIKAVLSANPWPSSSSKPAEDVVVMGIYGPNRLGYCRLGDKVWTSLPSKWEPFHDVIYYKGQFYATNQRGLVVAFDVADDYLQEQPKVTEIAQTDRLNIRKHVYLVECFGDLLQVDRTYNGEENNGFEVYRTHIGFEVCKLDHSDSRSCSNHKWVQVRDLNGCSLFLGDNASMSVNAADFPGCKPDCIYFTDDQIIPLGIYPWLGAQDIGVFCLHDQRFELHHPAKNFIMPAPIWIQPTL